MKIPTDNIDAGLNTVSQDYEFLYLDYLYYKRKRQTWEKDETVISDAQIKYTKFLKLKMIFICFSSGKFKFGCKSNVNSYVTAQKFTCNLLHLQSAKKNHRFFLIVGLSIYVKK